MNVFGHDDISHDDQPITPANPLQNLQKQITVGLIPQKRQAPVTTKRQKM